MTAGGKGYSQGWRLASAAFCLLALVAPAMASTSKIDAPKFVKPVTHAPPAGTRVNVVASTITYDSKSKIATATGLVRITYGPYTLTATKVVYDMQHDTFKANGSIELHEPNGNILQADYAEIYKKFKEGFARHVTALLTNDVTITAEYAKRTEYGITTYERATYTACKACVGAGGTPAWQIRAKQAVHDQDKQTIYYDDMFFDIAGVPVLYLPYLAYPDPTVKRRSGFLLPSLGYGKAYGFAMTTPYFWAMAPNADLTISPMWTTLQGPVADVELRHKLASGSYNIHGYGVYQLNPASATDGSGLRGAIESKGDFKINSIWSWGWDSARASDRFFYDDYGLKKTNILASNGYLTGMADRTYLSAQALTYQTLVDGQSQGEMPTVLPYLTGSHTFAGPVLGGELGLTFDAYSLSRDDPVPAFGLGTDQSRAVADINWRKQIVNGYGQVITPFVGIRGDLGLSQNVPGAPTSSEATAHLLPSAGLDMRWPFLASHGFGQSVLSPVVQLIGAANEQNRTSNGSENAVTLNFDPSNLFLQDRFTGLDRFEGGTRINAGLMYNFLGNDGGFLRVSGGESFHVAGANSFVAGSGLDGPASDLVGAIAFQPTDNFRLTYQARAEENLSKVNSQEFSSSLTFDRFSGSLSYADIAAAPAYGRPNDEQQVWGDASYRFTEAWSLFGGLRYDMKDAAFVDKSLGIAFDCECMTARLTYSESIGTGTLPVDRTLKLSVSFRTIGSVSGGFGL